MTYWETLRVRLRLWSIVPGFSARATFTRLLVRALINEADVGAGMTLSIDEAAMIVAKFSEWTQADEQRARLLLDSPARQIHVFLTLEPWETWVYDRRRELAKETTP